MFRFGTGFPPLNCKLSEFNRIESKLKNKKKLELKPKEQEMER